jgi:hypothetical protein
MCDRLQCESEPVFVTAIQGGRQTWAYQLSPWTASGHLVLARDTPLPRENKPRANLLGTRAHLHLDRSRYLELNITSTSTFTTSSRLHLTHTLSKCLTLLPDELSRYVHALHRKQVETETDVCDFLLAERVPVSPCLQSLFNTCFVPY